MTHEKQDTAQSTQAERTLSSDPTPTLTPTSGPFMTMTPEVPGQESNAQGIEKSGGAIHIPQTIVEAINSRRSSEEDVPNFKEDSRKFLIDHRDEFPAEIQSLMPGGSSRKPWRNISTSNRERIWESVEQNFEIPTSETGSHPEVEPVITPVPTIADLPDFDITRLVERERSAVAPTPPTPPELGETEDGRGVSSTARRLTQSIAGFRDKLPKATKGRVIAVSLVLYP